MRLAVLGRTHWLLNSAEHCIAEGHEVVLVATAKASPEYRAKETDFERLALRQEVPFYLAADINGEEFVSVLRSSRADVAISVNWPVLVRHAACAALPLGILNAHAGDLPRYRGNACPNWAILRGEPHVGVCVHAMDPTSVDAGPIYCRRRLHLDSNVYIGDVYAWLDGAVPAMFVEAIGRLADPAFVPEDQRASGITPLRCHPRRPEDGLIDWTLPAHAIARLVRASSHPFAGAFTYLEGTRKVTIWRGRALDVDHEELAVPGQIIGRGAAGGVLVACGASLFEAENAEVENGGTLPATNRFRLTRAAIWST